MGQLGRVRYGALLLAGAFTTHALRYALAYGADADRELLEQGHHYLLAAPLTLTLVLCASLAALVLRLARGGSQPERPAPLRTVWALSAAALLAMYGVQEMAEGSLADGHAHGLAALTAERGWLALPLALGVALGVALLGRAATATLAARRGGLRVPPSRALVRVLAWCPPTLAVACGELPRRGGRGPPAPAG